MYPDMGCFAAWMAIPGSEVGQLVSAIKNRILDFVLRIEAENPAAGEAAINSNPVPLQKLQPLVNNFFGAVGNVAQNSQHFSQTAESAMQPGELDALLEASWRALSPVCLRPPLSLRFGSGSTIRSPASRPDCAPYLGHMTPLRLQTSALP